MFEKCFQAIKDGIIEQTKLIFKVWDSLEKRVAKISTSNSNQVLNLPPVMGLSSVANASHNNLSPNLAGNSSLNLPNLPNLVPNPSGQQQISPASSGSGFRVNQQQQQQQQPIQRRTELEVAGVDKTLYTSPVDKQTRMQDRNISDQKIEPIVSNRHPVDPVSQQKMRRKSNANKQLMQPMMRGQNTLLAGNVSTGNQGMPPTVHQNLISQPNFYRNDQFQPGSNQLNVNNFLQQFNQYTNKMQGNQPYQQSQSRPQGPPGHQIQNQSIQRSQAQTSHSVLIWGLIFGV